MSVFLAKPRNTGLVIDALNLADKLSEQIGSEENEENEDNKELVSVIGELVDEINRARKVTFNVCLQSSHPELSSLLDRWEKIL